MGFCWRNYPEGRLSCLNFQPEFLKPSIQEGFHKSADPQLQLSNGPAKTAAPLSNHASRRGTYTISRGYLPFTATFVLDLS